MINKRLTIICSSGKPTVHVALHILLLLTVSGLYFVYILVMVCVYCLQTMLQSSVTFLAFNWRGL